MGIADFCRKACIQGVIILIATSALAQSAPVQIHFGCPSVDLATRVAENMRDLIPGVSPLPNQCYWVRDEKQATIVRLVKPVYLEDDVVWVAEVQRHGRAAEFSAGYLPADTLADKEPDTDRQERSAEPV